MSAMHNHSFASDSLMSEASRYHSAEGDRGTADDPASVLLAKGVTMIVLCSVSTCMGILPMFLAKIFKWNTDGVNPRSMKVVSLLLGFGGGVLFSTTFLHLIPEVTEGVGHLVEAKKLPQLNFSLAETLTCTGFFIMYLVEECVHTHLRQRQAKKQDNDAKDVNRSTNELVENGQANNINGHAHVHAHVHAHTHAHVGHSHLPVIMDDEDDDFVITSLRGLLIVLGLSVHELFEGLAIGLESSSGSVWYMFGAVAAHKFVIAFCIGVELIASKTRRYLSVIYVCTFAVVSPIGIGIGMALVGGGSAAASGPMAVILQGLASGTLLYVVFFEILQENRSGLQQYLSILVGFVLMFGIQVLTAHSHSHGGHGHSHGGTGHSHATGDHDDHDDHKHNLEHETGHSHDHSAHNKTDVLANAIDQVTESIAEVLSSALTSSTTTPSALQQRSTVNETGALHHHHS